MLYQLTYNLLFLIALTEKITVLTAIKPCNGNASILKPIGSTTSPVNISPIIPQITLQQFRLKQEDAIVPIRYTSIPIVINNSERGKRSNAT